jgi:hypothetical protein
MADRDILFAVRNNFYIGAYNNAINEASDMEGLSEAEQTERDVYVYRSYIALGSHDVSCAGSITTSLLKPLCCIPSTVKDVLRAFKVIWRHESSTTCAHAAAAH